MLVVVVHTQLQIHERGLRLVPVSQMIWGTAGHHVQLDPADLPSHAQAHPHQFACNVCVIGVRIYLIV
jgi:hypothetical protein